MCSLLCKYTEVFILHFVMILSAACICLVCYEWRANGTGFCFVQASSCYLSSGPGAGLPGFWNPVLDWETTDMAPKMVFSVTFFHNSVFSVTDGNIVCFLYPECHVPAMPFGSSALSCFLKLGLCRTCLMLSRVLGWENGIFGPKPQCLSLGHMKVDSKNLQSGQQFIFLICLFSYKEDGRKNILKRNWYFSLLCRAVNHNILWEKPSLNLETLGRYHIIHNLCFLCFGSCL